jgi:DNA-binding CsgD family transcriptional regulator
MKAKDADLLDTLKGVFGFCFGITSILLLCFASPLYYQRLRLAQLELPAVILFVAVSSLLLVVFRLQCAFLVSSRGRQFVRIAVLLGGCALPFLLLSNDLWLAAIPFIALGAVAAIYSWLLYLCRFGYSILVPLISISFTVASASVVLVTVLELPAAGVLGIECGCMLLSVMLFHKRIYRQSESLMQTSAAESKKRAITVANDRWTYSLIGVDLGFALGLFFRYFTGDLQGALVPAALADWRVLCFILPVLVATVLLLFFHSRFEYKLEKYSKKFLAFTVTVSTLPLLFLPDEAKLVSMMALLCISVIQVNIVVNASVEFIRFELLSPAWYLAEGAFLSVGSLLGIIIAWGCVIAQGEPLIESLCYSAIIAMNIFAQTFIDKGSYPTSDQFRSLQVKAPAKASAANGAQGTENGKAQPDVKEAQSEEKSFWKKKVAYVGQQYDLSPRQCEVLELLAKGRDAKFIQDHFYISQATTKSHIYNIYCKLNIHSRQELLDIIEAVYVPPGSDSA